MKKIILLLIMLGLFLVGCGSDNDKLPEQPSEVTPLPPSNPTILTPGIPTIPSIDISGIIFDDDEVDYDGDEHFLECVNVPEGVYIDYENNWQTEPGTYEIVAIVTDESGNELCRLTATLIINEVQQPVDISGVKLEAMEVDYDGALHSLECSNVPDGVTVEYVGNGVSEVGEHKVVAILKDSLGVELGRLEATITINEVILTVPVLSIDEFGVVTWEEVENATHYNYIINDHEIKTTTLLTITLENEQTISIQAANDEKVSGWSYAVTYFNTDPVYEEVEKDIYVKFYNTNLPTIKLTSGNKVEKPADPVKQYYIFDNWYADPFYQEVFDFNSVLHENTIIYANFIPTGLVENTYFWVKGSPQISSTYMSSGTTSDWHFMPLKENTANKNFKEFYVTVTVSGATSISPAAFIVMDGFSDDSGRTYWKNGESDFVINSDGVYNIYFSTEHQYSSKIHVYVEQVSNSAANLAYEYQELELESVVVSVDTLTDIASWEAVVNATGYEVIIDNNKAIYTTLLSVELAKGSHVTVRAVSDNKYSRWSLPKANIEVIYVDDKADSYSVYFMGYEGYQVAHNATVVSPEAPTKAGFSFAGWYLDYNCVTAAQFPYTVTSNTVFYPKWVASDDYASKIYYNLVLENGTVVKGLTWNLDNYTFDEYETGDVTLNANTNYYIVSTSNSNVKYGPYTVNTTGGYKIYFSEDNLWDGRNVYIANTMKTIYVTNNKRWSDTLYAYVWNSSSGKPSVSWPGTSLTFVETNTYGEDIYKFDIDASLYDMIILSHGTMTNGSFKLSSQTVDLKLSDYTTNAFYFTDKDANGKYLVGTWNK